MQKSQITEAVSLKASPQKLTQGENHHGLICFLKVLYPVLPNSELSGAKSELPGGNGGRMFIS